MNLEGYYINLEADRERRRTMEAQLDKLGLSGVVKRFPAVAGSDMAAPAGSPLSPAEAGCWMSHWRILQQASADRHLLVLEDDVILHRLTPAFLE
ncbi:MAG: glycosyltransferase family 25 protein, partial [Candidatus Neomarinimicrobiota bacterium]